MAPHINFFATDVEPDPRLLKALATKQCLGRSPEGEILPTVEFAPMYMPIYAKEHPQHLEFERAIGAILLTHIRVQRADILFQNILALLLKALATDPDMAAAFRKLARINRRRLSDEVMEVANRNLRALIATVYCDASLDVLQQTLEQYPAFVALISDGRTATLAGFWEDGEWEDTTILALAERCPLALTPAAIEQMTPAAPATVH
jgi:hypothetical protein